MVDHHPAVHTLYLLKIRGGTLDLGMFCGLVYIARMLYPNTPTESVFPVSPVFSWGEPYRSILIYQIPKGN